MLFPSIYIKYKLVLFEKSIWKPCGENWEVTEVVCC